MSGHLPVHMFTRTGDREAFEYQGRATAESVRDTRPVRVTWVVESSSAKPPAFLDAAHLGAAVDPATESEDLRAQRLGQAKFSSDLMKQWEGRCALTQVAMPEVLRASHIKAWRDSSPRERVDPHNGLLLAVHIDGIFDRGFLSFREDGRAVLSEAITPHTRQVFALEPNLRIDGLTERNYWFLAAHRHRYRDRLGLA